mmetsp:Transcript_4417/g.9999  ORF Transcript_4417/g.9999 Transcript_4417/m.9999 type:complete len:116 (-) Transcript_4417:1085-1432(-)
MSVLLRQCWVSTACLYSKEKLPTFVEHPSLSKHHFYASYYRQMWNSSDWQIQDDLPILPGTLNARNVRGGCKISSRLCINCNSRDDTIFAFSTDTEEDVDEKDDDCFFAAALAVL